MNNYTIDEFYCVCHHYDNTWGFGDQTKPDPNPWMLHTHSGPDEGRWISNVLETLVLDEIRNTIGEVLIVGFDVVLQYQTTQGPRWFICSEWRDSTREL